MLFIFIFLLSIIIEDKTDFLLIKVDEKVVFFHLRNDAIWWAWRESVSLRPSLFFLFPLQPNKGILISPSASLSIHLYIYPTKHTLINIEYQGKEATML